MTDQAADHGGPDSAVDRLPAEIRRRRRAAGLSQRELAARSGYTREYVSGAERPGNVPSRELVQVLGSVLDAGGALLDLRARAKAERLALRERCPAGQPGTVLTGVRARAEGYRRTTLDDTSAHGDEPLKLTAISAMSDAFQAADRRLGGGVLYGQIVRYVRTEIGPALLDPPRYVSPSDLFSAAASFAEIAGWMAHDSGRDAKARAHFEQAYHLAATGRNPILSANICASLAHLAIHLGQADDAARIASAGLTRVTRHEGAPHLVARLYAMKARAFALVDNEKHCRAALATANERSATSTKDRLEQWVGSPDSIAPPLRRSPRCASTSWACSPRARPRHGRSSPCE